MTEIRLYLPQTSQGLLLSTKLFPSGNRDMPVISAPENRMTCNYIIKQHNKTEAAAIKERIQHNFQGSPVVL
jgi:hypothetical protein